MKLGGKQTHRSGGYCCGSNVVRPNQPIPLDCKTAQTSMNTLLCLRITLQLLLFSLPFQARVPFISAIYSIFLNEEPQASDVGVFLVAQSRTSVRRADVYTAAKLHSSGRRYGVGRRVWLASDLGSSNYDHQRLPLQTHPTHSARAHWAITLLKNCRWQLRFDQRPLGFQPAASRLSYRGNSPHEVKKKPHRSAQHGSAALLLPASGSRDTNWCPGLEISLSLHTTLTQTRRH